MASLLGEIEKKGQRTERYCNAITTETSHFIIINGQWIYIWTEYKLAWQRHSMALYIVIYAWILVSMCQCKNQWILLITKYYIQKMYYSDLYLYSQKMTTRTLLSHQINFVVGQMINGNLLYRIALQVFCWSSISTSFARNDMHRLRG